MACKTQLLLLFSVNLACFTAAAPSHHVQDPTGLAQNSHTEKLAHDAGIPALTSIPAEVANSPTSSVAKDISPSHSRVARSPHFYGGYGGLYGNGYGYGGLGGLGGGYGGLGGGYGGLGGGYEGLGGGYGGLGGGYGGYGGLYGGGYGGGFYG